MLHRNQLVSSSEITNPTRPPVQPSERAGCSQWSPLPSVTSSDLLKICCRWWSQEEQGRLYSNLYKDLPPHTQLSLQGWPTNIEHKKHHVKLRQLEYSGGRLRSGDGSINANPSGAATERPQLLPGSATAARGAPHVSAPGAPPASSARGEQDAAPRDRAASTGARSGSGPASPSPWSSVSPPPPPPAPAPTLPPTLPALLPPSWPVSSRCSAEHSGSCSPPHGATGFVVPKKEPSGVGGFSLISQGCAGKGKLRISSRLSWDKGALNWLWESLPAWP